MKKKIKLKPFVIPTLYGIVTVSLIVSLIFIGNRLFNNYVPVTYITSSTITEDIEPVINETKEKTIIRPYKDENIKILQNFYETTSDKKVQENSLILYENTYLQNSGIDYGREEKFDIYSIYDGTIIDIVEDDILGKIIQIQHTNEIIASYQCLGDIKVNKNDTIIQGELIGSSGTCNISKNIGNHLHLEVSKEGKMINPELIFNKNINEIQG